jgi:hypothetical protein
VVTAAVPSVAILGEVMLRLAAPEGTQLASARVLDATFGGGDANVAASLASFDVPARFVPEYLRTTWAWARRASFTDDASEGFVSFRGRRQARFGGS